MELAIWEKRLRNSSTDNHSLFLKIMNKSILNITDRHTYSILKEA